MKILVATDGSRAARAAVQFAAKLAANSRNGELTVLAVATLRRDLAMTLPPTFFPAKSLRDLETGERESRRRDLEESVRGLETGPRPPRLRMVDPRRQGSVAEVISREADRERADLIVIGSEGHGAVAGWILGSVAQRLVATARRPVAVVHPPARARRR